MSWLLDSWSAVFSPFKVQSFILNGPTDRQIADCARKSSVFGGIGSEFMNKQRYRQGEVRRKKNIRSLQRCSRKIIWPKFDVQDRADARSLTMHLHNQVVGS